MPKTIRNVFDKCLTFEKLIEAHYRAVEGKRNKKEVLLFEEDLETNIANIMYQLETGTYKLGKYRSFKIYEPKERRIVSQNIHDKIINHLVARHILYPAILPCLIPENVASRKDKGTKEGLRLAQSFHRKCKIKYNSYYILKCDISKFFASINQDILKQKLERKIKDKDALNIVFKIINSEENGLGIGNMTSQVLAIFYLNDLDHYIKEELKIKYYVRYQDDFLLFHPSKEYLKECLKKIKAFLEKEHMTLNPKTRIYTSSNSFIFLGRNKAGKYAKYRDVNRRLKKRRYLYENGYISLSSLVNSYICYEHLCPNRLKKE